MDYLFVIFNTTPTMDKPRSNKISSLRDDLAVEWTYPEANGLEFQSHQHGEVELITPNFPSVIASKVTVADSVVIKKIKSKKKFNKISNIKLFCSRFKI